MTRVTAVIKSLGPGGSERLLTEYARVAADSGVGLSVISLLRQKQHLIPDIERAGVPVTCVGVSSLRQFVWLPRMLRALRTSRPEIVHVHSPSLAPAVRLAAHLRLLGWHRPRVVTTEHNRWSAYHPLTRFANATTALLDDATVAVSEEVRQSVRPRPLSDRAVTIRHGIDLELVRSQRVHRERLRNEWGARDDDVVVVTVANYRPQKNYPVLLRACALATAAVPNLKFVVVGQGPGEQSVVDLHGELGLGDRMLLLGYRSDATAVMSAADIFTLSSDYEGLPVALMEALAVGLAIVCTSVGGIAETVGADQGRLVAPNDPQSLAEAIVAVASNSQERAELQSASQHIGDSFDVRTSADSLNTLYRRVLRSR